MPLEDSLGLEAQQHVAKPCGLAFHQSGDFRTEDGQDQLLHTGDVWCTLARALEDAQVLPEQQEFKILLLLGLPSDRHEIEQQPTALGNETVRHSTSGTRGGQRS